VMNDNSRTSAGAATPRSATPESATPEPVTAAGETESAAPSPGEARSKARLDFNVAIRREGEGFRIEYSVTNRGATPVLLVNRGDTSFGLGPGRVYVEPQPDGTIHFTQRGYLLPPGQGPGPTAAIYPGVSELAPGQTGREILKVAAPKARQHPYARYYPQQPVPDPPRRVRFCLGVVTATDAQTKTTRGTRVLNSLPAVAAQELLCSEPQELD
ncbi:MAG: hypothetical protein ACRD68_04510, partial [Pyrinomonadaceae bacterium]